MRPLGMIHLPRRWTKEQIKGFSTLIEEIRIERLRRRWSQKRLALFAERSAMWLSHVERGVVIPHPNELNKIVVALGVEDSKFFQWAIVELIRHEESGKNP